MTLLFFFAKGGINLRGNKRKAVSKTAVKVIINMDIAVEALNKTEIANLHNIIDKLRKWDDKYYDAITNKGGI